MRRSSHWWIGLAGAGLIVAGCGGERGVTPLSSANAGGRIDRSTPFRKVGATPTPSPCGINPNTPVWRFDFGYTGAFRKWQVPPGVMQVTVVAQGAQGGNALGGCERATISVQPNETLTVVVGGLGRSTSRSGIGKGGFNGGGNGGAFCCGGSPGGGGGGASDVRQGGNGLANRVVVGGGGGGSSGGGWAGGAGGGPRGGNGDQSSVYSRGAGGGGSQTDGGKGAQGATDGSLGTGGTGGSKPTTGTFGGGGGGGGYYGGGGGRYSHHDDATDLDDGDSGGGGGSGYAASSAVNVVTVNGQRYGNGLVTIAWPQVTSNFITGLSTPGPIAADPAASFFVATATSSSSSTVYHVFYNATKKQVGTFGRIGALAVDAADNFYVSDLSAGKIYKVVLPAGDGYPGRTITLVTGVQAYALAVDGAGNLYYSDNTGKNNSTIKVRSKSGQTTQFTNNVDAVTSIAVSSTCKTDCPLYETDVYHGAFGRLYTYFAMFDSKGNKTPITIVDHPTAVAVGPSNGVIVVDNQSNLVWRIPFEGAIYGAPEPVGSGWQTPQAAAISPGDACLPICPVYVTDTQHGSIVEVH
ncbi:MAG TPA: glycine-rich protein [Candidatus Baltobacteraceae bacterium]|nr:glycine-rich protein [Candidatus Baltobacteraceae bacterium]